MSDNWLSEKRIEQKLQKMPVPMTLPEHYWLSHYYEHAVFHATYLAPEPMADAIRLTQHGDNLRQSCASHLKIPLADVTLAVYGRFFHHDMLVDHAATDVATVVRLLEDDLLHDRIRLPFIWGRRLHDRFNDGSVPKDVDRLTHAQTWDLLDETPVGVFQHGYFVSGPLGILRSAEHRWLPAAALINCYVREGTRTNMHTIGFDLARIKVVEAYQWIEQSLSRDFGPPSEWGPPLSWMHNRQCNEARTDYADICPVIAECVLNQERAVLFEAVLKTDSGKFMRETIRSIHSVKGLRGVSPSELPSKLSSEQQLQLLLTIPTEVIVACLDRAVLSGDIVIPTSEIRLPKKRPPSKNVCFRSEISSLGIRPGHIQPFAAFCSSILRAYIKTESTNELGWRLQSDPSRGLEVTLTDFIRREGPREAVSKLILASRPVTMEVCNDIHLDVGDTIPRTELTISRILWKSGFEIARHDDVLSRLNKWLQQFEALLSKITLGAGETARDKIRSEAVNVFGSVEKLLDRLIAFNVWLLASDHWAETRFEYRLSDARRKVSALLGDSIQSGEDALTWKTSGENALGTQLAYLNEFELWLDGRDESKKERRQDVDLEVSSDHSGRPFPFRHTQLWADSEVIELQRYKALLRSIVKTIAQADVAGVRNGVDHYRDAARFPTEDALWTCVTRLRAAVRMAEEKRVYPVTYWFDSKVERVFGTSEHSFKSSRGDIFTIFRPSTVDALPPVTRINPVIFAPINFLGAADSLLFFKDIGESEYSRYWSDYPRISRILPGADEAGAREFGDAQDSHGANLVVGNKHTVPLNPGVDEAVN